MRNKMGVSNSAGRSKSHRVSHTSSSAATSEFGFFSLSPHATFHKTHEKQDCLHIVPLHCFFVSLPKSLVLSCKHPKITLFWLILIQTWECPGGLVGCWCRLWAQRACQQCSLMWLTQRIGQFYIIHVTKKFFVLFFHFYDFMGSARALSRS